MRCDNNYDDNNGDEYNLAQRVLNINSKKKNGKTKALLIRWEENMKLIECLSVNFFNCGEF